MKAPELAWYVGRLAQIPCSPVTGVGVLGEGFAGSECRRIGFEIHRLHGNEGMAEVCQACREALDANTAADIARVWAGIGQWQG